MTKRLCVLQVTPSEPNKDHIKYFNSKELCDFYFVTHDNPHDDALQYCPNTKWADTRNILAAEVPKEYDYYAFIDYDYILRPQRNLDPLEQIIEDLDFFEPAVLTYYPGNNLETPYAKDKKYRDSKEYSCIPFTHAGLKIVHHSLMKWFFPMTTTGNSDIESCHMFNIQEIPFLRHVICSHKMIYDNGYSDLTSEYNRNAAAAKRKMDDMWLWIKPAFKQTKLINFVAINEEQKKDSLIIKRALVKMFKEKQITPERSPKNVNYFDKKLMDKFFDLNHEHFKNIDLPVKEQYSWLKRI